MQRDAAISLLLILAVVAVYWPVAGHDFVDFDDNGYVYENPHVLRGLTWDGAAWALASTQEGNWHPLTWLSHMLDCQLFGPAAGWHHAVNAVFHAASAVLLFLVLKRMTAAPWPSALVAALFALHPLHVESVAWVAERKDVLSTFFALLAIGAYARYAERPSAGRYAPVFIFLALGLLAKPMLVTLPLVLLLLDYWPLKRLTRQSAARLVTEKVPLFVLAAASCAVTYAVQQHEGAMKFAARFPLPTRLTTAMVAYVEYLRLTVWPQGLVPFYPYVVRPWYWAAGAAAGLVAVTVLVIYLARRRPYLAVGWLWYLGTLVPVIGLVQVGAQALADRYTYVPLVGIFMAAAWGAADLMPRWRHRLKLLVPVSAAVLIACMVLSWQQVRCWSNTETLFRHAVAVMPENGFAHAVLGGVRYRQGRLDEAAAEYREATRILPGDTEVMTHLGMVLASQGRFDEAARYHRQATRLEPDYALAHRNLAYALARQGKFDEAAAEYREALRLQPADPVALSGLGEAFARRGQYDEAIRFCRDALRLNPDYAAAHHSLGMALAAQGNRREAVAEYREALRLETRDPAIHLNLAAVLLAEGKPDEVLSLCREALAIDPQSAVAHNTWGSALVSQGKIDEAVGQFRQALQADPNYANAHYNLATVLARAGKFDEAAAHFAAVLRIDPAAADAHRGLAGVLAARGETDLALTHLAQALRLRPDWPPALNQLARLLATAPQPARRNAAEAVRLAEQACRLTARKEPTYLDTLAAAYAGAGRPAEAVATAREAAALARAQGRPDLAAQIDSRLRLYESGRPLRPTP